MTTPKPDHPWYGRRGGSARRKTASDVLLDKEIERALLLERGADDRNDMEGYLRPARDPSYMAIENGLRRVPVRYDGGE